MPQLDLTTTVTGLHVDRLASLDNVPIAIAYFDGTGTNALAVTDEAVLAWPTQTVPPWTVIDKWLTDFMPFHTTTPTPTDIRVEFWLDTHFHERRFTMPTDGRALFTFVDQHRLTLSDTLRLIMIAAGDTVLELTFDARHRPEHMIRCACVVRRGRLQPLAQFFRAFHANPDVRTNGELALQVFATDSAFIPDPLGLLHPLPLTA